MKSSESRRACGAADCPWRASSKSAASLPMPSRVVLESPSVGAPSVAKRARMAVLPRTRSRAALRSGWAATLTNAPSETPSARARGRDRPAKALGLGADGEVDLLRVSRSHLDHLRPRRGDRHRDLRLPRVGDPRHPARRPVLELHLLAPEEALDLDQRPLELVHVDRLTADLAQRRVAATEPQDGAAARFGLQRGDRRGGHRRNTRGRVGDAGPDPDPLRRRGREPELDPELGVQVLAVGEQHAVEVPALDLGGVRCRFARERERVHPDLDAGILSPAPELATQRALSSRCPTFRT
jgi:hypothetical protein